MANKVFSGKSASQRAIQKWGGFASFLLVVSLLAAGWIYLTGQLEKPLGPASYALADLMYGPVFAASLVTAVFALRERIGAGAPRRMGLALLAAVLAAGAMVAVASIRANNRQYFLETNTAFLYMWETLVAGISGVGWHFLGWALVLIGWSGWTSGRLPRLLSALYLAAGATALFVYALPENEGGAAFLLVVVSIWQGILMWRGATEGRRAKKRRSE